MPEENIAMNETENLDNAEVQEVESAPTIEDLISNFDASDIVNHPALKKAIQSVTDTRVTQAVKTAKKNWEKEAAENLDEAHKLEKMTEDQRTKYQLEKEKNEFEAQKKAFQREQLRNSTGNELLKRGYNAKFADFINAETADDAIEKIDALEALISETVSNAKNSMMKGFPPKEKAAPERITKDSLKNMSAAEINANWDAVQEALKN